MCNARLVPISLFVLFGCGGGGGGSAAGAAPSGDVTLSATAVEPTESFELRHGSIRRGATVEVQFDVAGFEYVLPFTALRDGAVRVAVPPILDPATGAPTNGTAKLSLVGVSSSATVDVGGLRVLEQSVGPGDACGTVIGQTVENLDRAKAELELLRDENPGEIDVADALAEIATNRARLMAIRDEVQSTGRMSIELADGGEIDLGPDDLKLADRFIATWLTNYVAANDLATDAVVARVSSDKPALTHEQIRELVRRVQSQAGRADTRSRENEEALAGVVIGAGGALSGPVGVAANAFGALVSAGQIVVSFQGSEITLRLTANSLNGDRVAGERLSTTAAGLGGIGLAAASIIGAYFGSVVIVPLVSVVGLSLAIASALGTANSSGDINIHIPDRDVEFSELRVQDLGSFAFPLVKTTLLDPGPIDRPTNVYSLSFYGLQPFGDTFISVGGLWSALNVTEQIPRITYGTADRGEVNTARGVGGGPPVPAPSLAGIPLFGIIATGGRDTDFGNPANPTSQRGEIDVKYVDGPVVFTFDISPSIVGVSQFPVRTQPITLAGRITNESSIPLTIYGLEFEFVPGQSAFEPVFDGPGELVTVPSGETRSFELTDVRLEIPSSWIGNPQIPRLVVDNGGSGLDLVSPFWSRLRSVQALSGPFEIVD